MKRDIKVNYGVIGEVVNKLRIYKEALTTIREVVESINEKIESENSGKAVEELKKIGEKINKDLKLCKNEIEDLYELFNGYNNEMQEIIRPNNINEIMQVDRNDIYWNMKSIFNACDAVGNIKYNTDYYGGYDYGFGDSEEEKRNK